MHLKYIITLSPAQIVNIVQKIKVLKTLQLSVLKQYNPIGNKALLTNGVSTIFIKSEPALINGLRKFKNPLHY